MPITDATITDHDSAAHSAGAPSHSPVPTINVIANATPAPPRFCTLAAARKSTGASQFCNSAPAVTPRTLKSAAATASSDSESAPLLAIFGANTHATPANPMNNPIQIRADNLVPVVNADGPAGTDEVAEILNGLSETLTTEDLAELNRRVDEDREQAADVAKDYLTEKGLLEA